MKLIQQSFQIDETLAGKRLDHALQRLMPDYSRSKIQHWIQQGFVCINQHACKPKHKVYRGDLVELEVPTQIKTSDLPEAIEFKILYQDDDVFVIDKPADLVVHPGAGNAQGTLVNGLLARDPGLEQIARAGIVHRLDKDTTGVMVVARNLTAHTGLVAQLQARQVKREYIAISQGVVNAGRSIETGIARHPRKRTQMSVQSAGKMARTHLQVVRKFKHYSLLKLRLETGRTHQIRVHMAHINHPLVGDPVYAGRIKIPTAVDPVLVTIIQRFKRQALHAQRLGFVHPRSQEPLSFEAALPDDFQQLYDALIRYD